jgi:copper chaperone
MAETEIKIEGMSCQHCVMAVKKQISSLPGIVKADVAIGEAKVTYEEAKVSKTDMEKAIEKAGFTVKK